MRMMARKCGLCVSPGEGCNRILYIIRKKLEIYGLINDIDTGVYFCPCLFSEAPEERVVSHSLFCNRTLSRGAN